MSLDDGVDPKRQKVLAMMLANAQAVQQPGSGVLAGGENLDSLRTSAQPPASSAEPDLLKQSGDPLRSLKTEEKSHAVGSTQNDDPWNAQFKQKIHDEIERRLTFQPKLRSAWQVATHSLPSPQEQQALNDRGIENLQRMLTATDSATAMSEYRQAMGEERRSRGATEEAQAKDRLTPRFLGKQFPTSILAPGEHQGHTHWADQWHDAGAGVDEMRDTGLEVPPPVAKADPNADLHRLLIGAQTDAQRARAARDRAAAGRPGKGAATGPLETNLQKRLDSIDNDIVLSRQPEAKAKAREAAIANYQYLKKISPGGGAQDAAAAMPDEGDDSGEMSDAPTVSSPPAGGASKAGGKPSGGQVLFQGEKVGFRVVKRGK